MARSDLDISAKQQAEFEAELAAQQQRRDSPGFVEGQGFNPDAVMTPRSSDGKIYGPDKKEVKSRFQQAMTGGRPGQYLPTPDEVAAFMQTEEGLRAVAREESKRLEAENAGVIEQQADDLATRVEGDTNYGQEVEPAVAAHIARNASQADVSRNESLSRRPGESSRDYMLRMAVDPNAKLNSIAREEKTFRRSEHFYKSEKAIRQVLDYGYGGNRRIDPTMQQLASEFVLQYPREYKAMLAERRGEAPTAPMQTPEEREAALKNADEMMASVVSENPNLAGATSRGAGEARFKSLGERNPEEAEKYLSAAGGDKAKAAELYMQQLRKERGVDKESRMAAKTDQKRATAAQSILRRHAGDEGQINRALENYNRKNPDAPMRPEDLGISRGGSDITARPGDIVEADSLSSLNPRKIANGAIISTPNGAFVSRQFPDGTNRGVPVMQDANTGFFFVDPNATNRDGTDAYPDMESYNSALTRQDRVKFRRALINSGNSVFANEQRRLDAAREAASSGIPEIREAGMKEVAALEAELHYRYVTEQADMTGLSTGQRQIEELPKAGSRGRGTGEGPTVGEVREEVAERLGDRKYMKNNPAFAAMTPDQQAQFVYNQLMENDELFDPSSSGSASPSEAPSEEPGAEQTPSVDTSQAGTTNAEVTDSSDELAKQYVAQFNADLDKLEQGISNNEFLDHETGRAAFVKYFKGRYGIFEAEFEASFKSWWKTNMKDRPYSSVLTEFAEGKTAFEESADDSEEGNGPTYD